MLVRSMLSAQSAQQCCHASFAIYSIYPTLQICIGCFTFVNACAAKVSMPAQAGLLCQSCRAWLVRRAATCSASSYAWLHSHQVLDMTSDGAGEADGESDVSSGGPDLLGLGYGSDDNAPVKDTQPATPAAKPEAEQKAQTAPVPTVQPDIEAVEARMYSKGDR